MALIAFDPSEFLVDGLFREDQFIEGVENYDWNSFRDRSVLVRGCGSIIFPPWAFMIIASRLSNLARSVRYGNEHDNIVVSRTTTKQVPGAGSGDLS